MAIKNKTRYAILGILSIGPGTGYDIKKYCDTIISNFWNENFGHIYPVLNSLLEEGCIEKKEEETSSRKKEYYITDRGKDEFIKWLTEPVEYQPVRSEFMLKLTFSNHLSKEVILVMLSDYRQRHENKLKQLKKMEYSLNQGISEISTERIVYLSAPLRFGILSAEAAITWCNETIKALNDENTANS